MPGFRAQVCHLKCNRNYSVKIRKISSPTKRQLSTAMMIVPFPLTLFDIVAGIFPDNMHAATSIKIDRPDPLCPPQARRAQPSSKYFARVSGFPCLSIRASGSISSSFIAAETTLPAAITAVEKSRRRLYPSTRGTNQANSLVPSSFLTPPTEPQLLRRYYRMRFPSYPHRQSKPHIHPDNRCDRSDTENIGTSQLTCGANASFNCQRGSCLSPAQTSIT